MGAGGLGPKLREARRVHVKHKRAGGWNTGRVWRHVVGAARADGCAWSVCVCV
jgi:hypothetical protein